MRRWVTHFGIRVFVSRWCGGPESRYFWRAACDPQGAHTTRIYVATTQVPADVTCKACRQRRVFKEADQQGIWPGMERV